jgi:hypothetical protein
MAVDIFSDHQNADHQVYKHAVIQRPPVTSSLASATHFIEATFLLKNGAAMLRWMQQSLNTEKEGRKALPTLQN